MSEEELFTVPEVAKELSLSHSTVYALIRDGHLLTTRITPSYQKVSRKQIDECGGRTPRS